VDTDLIIVIVLLLLSGFFSASETALMTLTPAKVRMLLEAGKPGAGYLAKLKKHHHKTLITILVGNNFVNIAASALTAVYVTERFNSSAVGIATGVLTAIVLIFGEIFPKTLATSYAKRFALISAPILYVLGIILTPLIWILDLLVKILLRVLGTKKQKQVTDEDLIAMASIGAEEGSIEAHEKEYIENVLEFTDIQVGDIMTPRVHMDALPEEHDLEAAANFVLHHTHSRIPVYRDTMDNIVGILSIKELLKQLYNEENPDKITLRQVNLHTPLKVPGTVPIQKLFHQFKLKRTHMAIVLDEHGGTAGLITMEDLLEEIVGDIEDEEDKDEDEIREIKTGVYELSGRTELDELMELTGLELDHPEYKTVSFLMVEELGRIPKKGEKIIIDDWEFKITKMLRSTIMKIELRKAKLAKEKK